MIAVVVSLADRASEHVGEHLRELADWTEREDESRDAATGGGTYYCGAGFELRTFADLHLELEGVAAAFDGPELVVFASRHAGGTGPLLTAHHTGNLGPAEFGGRDGALAQAAPNALARLYRAFDRRAPEGYDVGLECTHHGPSDVGAPSLFAELGSGPEQWDDPAGAEAVARAILDLAGVEPHRDRQLVGLGGGHYVPRFERVVRETDWAVGHVAADWALERVDGGDALRDVLRQAFERSAADVALVDGDRPDLVRTVEALGFRVASETWLGETSGVPLALVERVEATLGAVEAGVRFGDLAGDAEAFEVDDLPAGLVRAANGVDRERVRAAVAARTVGYATDDGGTRVAGPVAVVEEADRDVLVDALADVLRTAYDSVERHGDTVVATREAFDPEAARELGVPEGPAFGRLAEGETVTVDGETIRPEMVVREETCRFEIS